MAIQKTLLMILDGWGIGNKDKSDVIFSTPTPCMDKLEENYPSSQLETSGAAVGLPEGQMGNSEVGHLNIGAGRTVYQDLVKINKSIEDDTLKDNENIISAFKTAKENKKKLHFVGLIGDGGVHSMSAHLLALCELAKEFDLSDVFIHGLTDGRDTDPRSGLGFVKTVLDKIEDTPVQFASLIGRYFGMDRDNNWDRVKKAYNLHRYGKGKHAKYVDEAIEASYDEGITDEFIEPIVITDDNDKPIATFEDGDVVICFNFRTDRLRQLTIAFTQKNIPEHELQIMPSLHWYTMTEYKSDFKDVTPIFGKTKITQTMGEVVSNLGLRQIRIAETEKFAHVTFFFSGGKEDEFPNEKRILIPSPKVATYDLQPEMSALIVTDKLIEELNRQSAEFICLNFANGDMVGHTGVYKAITKAVKTIDGCVGKIVDACKKNGYELLIIADHGNADFAFNADGSPNTAHTTNPVPCIWVTDKKGKSLKNGILADISPTLLTMMGVDIPEEMTGNVLIY